MKVKTKELREKIIEIKQKEGLTNKDISKIMQLDYSHIYNIVQNKAKPGRKTIVGIENFCKMYHLNVNDYIFF